MGLQRDGPWSMQCCPHAIAQQKEHSLTAGASCLERALRRERRRSRYPPADPPVHVVQLAVTPGQEEEEDGDGLFAAGSGQPMGRGKGGGPDNRPGRGHSVDRGQVMRCPALAGGAEQSQMKARSLMARGGKGRARRAFKQRRGVNIPSGKPSPTLATVPHRPQPGPCPNPRRAPPR